MSKIIKDPYLSIYSVNQDSNGIRPQSQLHLPYKILKHEKLLVHLYRTRKA